MDGEVEAIEIDGQQQLSRSLSKIANSWCFVKRLEVKCLLMLEYQIGCPQ